MTGHVDCSPDPEDGDDGQPPVAASAHDDTTLPDTQRRTPSTSDGELPLLGLLVTYDDAPDELTLVPPDVDEDDVTTWMSASEGSFVDLADMR
jgi:hypothetical protein